MPPMKASERAPGEPARYGFGTETMKRLKVCPRCGRDTMKHQLYTNALSRVADIMVCDECGVDEAKLAFMNVPTSLYHWAGLQPDRPASDFKAMPGGEVWQILSTQHAPVLFRPFERHLNGDDDEEIRLAAFESCPGLTQIWTQPFQMKFEVADGTLVLRFKKTDSGNEVCADLLPGK